MPKQTPVDITVNTDYVFKTVFPAYARLNTVVNSHDRGFDALKAIRRLLNPKRKGNTETNGLAVTTLIDLISAIVEADKLADTIRTTAFTMGRSKDNYKSFAGMSGVSIAESLTDATAKYQTILSDASFLAE